MVAMMRKHSGRLVIPTTNYPPRCLKRPSIPMYSAVIKCCMETPMVSAWSVDDGKRAELSASGIDKQISVIGVVT